MYKLQTYIINKEGILKEARIVEKIEAHENDLLHKSVHLIILCDKKILARKREKDESRYGGLFISTIGTHILSNDNYISTIEKFLPTQNLALKFAGEFFVHDEWENEINGLFIAETEYENLPKDFVFSRELFTIEELKEIINRGEATPHLAGAFKLLQGKLII